MGPGEDAGVAVAARSSFHRGPELRGGFVGGFRVEELTASLSGGDRDWDGERNGQ